METKLALQRHLDRLTIEQNTYAAFDLDNTLLLGDIGEAVFAKLLNDGAITDFSWSDYWALVAKDRKKGYNRAISAMNGLHVDLIKEVTRSIIRSKDDYFTIEGDNVEMPKVNPTMQQLLKTLQTKGIEVYVVTASNNISGEVVCEEFFGLDKSHVLGAPVEILEDGTVFYNEEGIPYADGKVEALKPRFSHRPIVTGGDGLWDKYLLHYTAPEGIRLWLGSAEDYATLSQEFDAGFYHIDY